MSRTNTNTGGGGGGTGTVLTVSVASLNGFSGISDGNPANPTLTLSTTETGILKGNGTAISAAIAGTDYQLPISLTTTGTSGAATFIANVLNIPQYQAAGTYVTSVGATGPITSSGGTTPVISTSMSTNRLIGRSTAGTGVMEEITIGSGLSLSAGSLTATAVSAPIYPSTRIPFGDGATAGGITNADITWTQASRQLLVGDTTSTSGGGYLTIMGNGGTMLFASKINSVTDSIIFTANSISGTGLSTGWGDLSDSIAAGAGARMFTTLNNAGTVNNIKIQNGLGNVFFNADLANSHYFFGEQGVGVGKLDIDNVAENTFLSAGNGASSFPINFNMDAVNGEIAAGDTSSVPYFFANQDNTSFGYTAGNAITSGIENAFFGHSAGALTSSGGRNAFFGFQAGSANTTGVGNSAFGWDTGLNLTTGSHNTFLGQQAGNHTTTADSNVAVGFSALFDNITGQENTAVGTGAGNASLGKNNAFFGFDAGLSFTGSDSVFVGSTAAQNFDGTNGLFIGKGVAPTDTSSDGATIIGNNADGGGNAVTVLGNAANSGSGKWLTVIGEGSGSASLTGNGDTIIGRGAGTSITSGSYNTLLGYGTNVSSGARSYGIALGAYANTGSNTLSIGGDDGAGAGYIDQVLIGNNSQNAAPHAVVMSLTSYDTSATNTSGVDFTFRPGMGTGSALAGDIVLGAGSPGASSTAGNPNIDANRFNGNSVTTTNATPANIPVLYPASDATYVFEALVAARYITGAGGSAGNSAGYFIRGTFKSIGGTLTQIGTTARDIWEDVAGYDADFAIVSNVLEVQVTGVASATIQWKVATQFTRIVL